MKYICSFGPGNLKNGVEGAFFRMPGRIRVYHFSGGAYANFFHCQTPFIPEIREK